MTIALEQIFDHRKINRRGLDEAHITALAGDFQLNGQLQPIAVRKALDGTWDLVAGANRIAAALLLGWTEIEAYDTKLGAGIEAAALAENVRRSQLSAIEESDQVMYMHTELDMSMNEISERTGHSISWVQDRIALAAYAENIKQAVHERKLSIGAAGQLMLIEDPEHRDWCLHLARVNGATVNQCQAWYLDWVSRQQLMNPKGYNGQQPQPLPPARGPRFACFTCDEHLFSDELLVMRICVSCHDEIAKAKTQPPTALEYPAPSVQTSDGKDA